MCRFGLHLVDENVRTISSLDGLNTCPTDSRDYINTLLRCAARHDVSAPLRWAFYEHEKRPTAELEYMLQEPKVVGFESHPRLSQQRRSSMVERRKVSETNTSSVAHTHSTAGSEYMAKNRNRFRGFESRPVR